MLSSLDHIVLAVRDLDSAAAAYAGVLGRAPSWRGTHPALGTRNVLFSCGSVYLELLAATAASTPVTDALLETLGERDERLFALALGVHDIDTAVAAAQAGGLRVTHAVAGEGVDERGARRRTWRSAFVDPDSVRGLRLLLIQHTSPPDTLPHGEPAGAEVSIWSGLDHVVMFTADLDASRALWVERFGLVERWRKDFPERHTHNLGLDLAGVTLELVTRTDKPAKPARDALWGVAYRVRDCDAAVTRVRAAGFDADDARPGLAPRTHVTTVRWSRTPTLLLAREPRPSGRTR
jgi:catechol 2,3-dioxygenase-like lactoylglutathione lyase family enzyme